jgi:phosphoglycerate dehydrogenase-like enzyme
VKDAEIFAPMLPLTDSTRGLVTAEHIDALPQGCLVVLATRAHICDMNALRRRVLAGQLALAADVFDVEPLPLNDPLLGRHNVVHTPHLAGRTRDANFQWADDLLAQFEPDVG